MRTYFLSSYYPCALLVQYVLNRQPLFPSTCRQVEKSWQLPHRPLASRPAGGMSFHLTNDRWRNFLTTSKMHFGFFFPCSALADNMQRGVKTAFFCRDKVLVHILSDSVSIFGFSLFIFMTSFYFRRWKFQKRYSKFSTWHKRGSTWIPI